jgi:hypothetical protein
VLDDAQAFAIGQPHVGQAQIEGLFVEQADGVGHRFRARRVEPHARQRELEQLEQIRLVVDNEHFGLSADFSYHDVLPCAVRAAHLCRSLSRRRTLQCDPEMGAGALGQQLERGAVRSASRAIAKASVPPGRVVKNGSKICGRNSAGMPGPSSVNSQMTASPM